MIAGNKCRDFYKKKKPLYYEDIPWHESGKVGDEDNILLKELVRQLPRNLEEIIILRFY